MSKKMLIDASHPEETRVVVVDGNRIEQFDFESISKKQIGGNVYLARVTRVEPSLQAAFIEYGGNRHGFLAFSEIHPDYYHLPYADRMAMRAEEESARAARRAAAAREEEREAPAAAEEPRESSGGRRGGRGRRGEARDPRDAREGRDPRGGREAAKRSAAPAPRPERAEEELPEGGVIDPAPPRAVPEPKEGGSSRRSRRSRGRGRDRRRPEGRGGWIETLETSVELESGERARLFRLERRPAEDESDEAQEDAEEAGQRGGERVEREITLESGEKALLIRPGRRRPRLMAADFEDSVGEDEERRPSRFGRSRRFDPRASEETEEAEEGADEVETVGQEDAREEVREEAPPRRYIPRGRQYKIQEVIKKRQILLVQVVKEERGGKGAALTTYLSLAGRYCVLMPNSERGGGVSRKITSATDRQRLKEIMSELETPQGMGLIVRTAGADRTKAEIRRDYEYLLRQWAAIRELTLASMAPALIYEEGNLIKRAIRDLYTRDIDEVLVEGDDAYREAKDFMKMLTPSHAKNVKPYKEDVPLFIRHQVESQLTAMFNPIVHLRSGGYIVIGVTEALVAIDVNSGRSTREHNIEDTAFRTNLEAAEEIARQLRLRDLAGLIVIDFIDMENPNNDRAVEKRIKDCLKNDRARMQIGKISSFGLLEMSRQRLRPGLLEASTTPCPHCGGVGHVRSDESLALSILREAEEEGVRQPGVGMRIQAPVAIANFIMNHKRERILSLERRYGLMVYVEGDPSMHTPHHRLERFAIDPSERVIEGGPINIEAGFAGRDEEEEAPASRAPRRIEISAPEPEPEEEEEAQAAAPVEEAAAPESPRRGRDRREKAERPPRERRERGRRDPLPVIDLAPETAEGPALAPGFAPKPEEPAPAPQSAKPERPRSDRRERFKDKRRPREEAPPAAPAESVAPEAPAVAMAAPAPQTDDLASRLIARPDALDAAMAQMFIEAEEPAKTAPPPAPEREPVQVVARPEPEPVAAAPEPDRPKKKGWWSRG